MFILLGNCVKNSSYFNVAKFKFFGLMIRNMVSSDRMIQPGVNIDKRGINLPSVEILCTRILYILPTGLQTKKMCVENSSRGEKEIINILQSFDYY